jgi:hypothetical protein
VGRSTVAGAAPRPDVRRQALAVLEAAWRPPGFCVPNAATYPWQWLWDSCFHAVCWAHLGRTDRAITELSNALAHQQADGFVPHMTYWSASGAADDETHAAFWRRAGTSSITQPPMYGHAVAELAHLGITVPDDVIERARRGLRHLLEDRNGDGRGPRIFHPWESGCDDSPRWDAWCGGSSAWSPARWKQAKGELVAALSFDLPSGSPRSSDAFEVVSAGFVALVAFNALELAGVTGDEALAASAQRAVERLDARWSADHGTWVDEVVVGPATTAAARTADALLAVLVSRDDTAVAAAFDQLLDGEQFGGRFGPAGVHRDEPAFDPHTYWRGPAWPQLAYLLWVAATRRGHAAAPSLAESLLAGATGSGFAEYWEPDTGEGLGAAPQSWTALAAVVAGAP